MVYKNSSLGPAKHKCKIYCYLIFYKRYIDYKKESNLKKCYTLKLPQTQSNVLIKCWIFERV